MKTIFCSGCAKNKRPSPTDDGFCSECVNRIDGLMNRCRAARAIIQTNAAHAEKQKMFAFLSIFHPELGFAKIRELSNDAEEQR